MKTGIPFLRRSIFLLWMFGVSLTLAGQPRLFLPGGTRIDLGKLPEMVETHYSISLRNIGSDTLRLDTVSTSCGCTVAKLRRRNVPPGDSTFIEVKFNNKEINGPSLRHVFILTNDTLLQKVDVEFAGTIIPVLKANPRYISFGTMKLHEKVRKLVQIENTSEDTIEIVSAHCFDERVKLNLGRRVIPPHVSAEVIAECDASNSAKLLGEISFGTNSAIKPLLRISYTGRIVR